MGENMVWCFTLSFVGHITAYIVLLGVFVALVFLILRYLNECNEEGFIREESMRHSLLAGKTITLTYGTSEKDIESGSSGSSSSMADQDLYNMRICVVCYDEQRSCFFVPCGHSATCHGCARRIFYEENRNCPVCRRFIGKIRKLCKL
ncbi:hypothetical protein Nepgr_027050 [Nepenthes gracilis]|uniref:RING-type domain-containing protein n=1 Tax=Nepenthes gracilis TaxID=150966 RepID=A0AAD3T9A5_NEPGR|nr:hypothetical protein Nepgr_027050 [Nepenthes gracilis]